MISFAEPGVAFVKVTMKFVGVVGSPITSRPSVTVEVDVTAFEAVMLLVNDAVCPTPLGGPPAVQLAAVFQSRLPAVVAVHVASAPRARAGRVPIVISPHNAYTPAVWATLAMRLAVLRLKRFRPVAI